MAEGRAGRGRLKHVVYLKAAPYAADPFFKLELRKYTDHFESRLL